MPEEDQLLGRYEVALDTPVDLWDPRSRRPIPKRLPRPTEPVKIVFEDRIFTWHPGGEEYHPSVSVQFADIDNYQAEREAMEHFLLTLSFHLRQPIRVMFPAAQYPRAVDTPSLARQPRRGTFSLTAPLQLVIEDDSNLRLALGLFRDAATSESPFYEFLGYYKVLEVVTGSEEQRDVWIDEQAPASKSREWRVLAWELEPPSDWSDYFRDSSRNAVAHAIRSRKGAVSIDPDDPDDQSRLARDAVFLKELARVAIEGRWPDAVKGSFTP
jgi:hypothetical protein